MGLSLLLAFLYMKKLIIISALLFSFNGWPDDSAVEHFSSEQTIKQNFPFSDAVRVDNTVYISGMIGEDENGNLVEGGIVPEAHTVMKKMGKILAHFNLGYDDVVKCLVIIDDIGEWSCLIQYMCNILTNLIQLEALLVPMVLLEMLLSN